MTGWRLLTLLLLPVLPAAVSANPHDNYWHTPIAAQDPAPPPPSTCAGCHQEQYRDWSGSRHAHSFSAGLVGQIIDYDNADVRACLACHAPLSEQQEAVSNNLLVNPATNVEATAPLARHGVYCAVCHLRNGTLHAPSRMGSANSQPVHEQVKIEPLMADSRFCAACHQFDMDRAINGKPLQNTYREWLASPYPLQGKHCQSCHMPDKAHRFRGIHDPAMARRGLSIETGQSPTHAWMTVENSGTGHHFPTYAVPRVTLSATLLDANGQIIPGGYREHVVQRLMSISGGHWKEHSDTRLRTGESVRLLIPQVHEGQCADTVRFLIQVEPEWFYRERVYPVVLRELEEGTAKNLIERAIEYAKGHDFVLFEKTLQTQCQSTL